MEVLEIRRKWNQTGTQIRINTSNDGGISVSIPLDEAIRIIKEQIGSVAFVFSKDALSKKIDSAFDYILKNMGADTKHHASVIPQ